MEHHDLYRNCPLEQHGSPLILWIANISGSCVYGDLSAVSWIAGYVSFFAWLGAQLPQVYMNYANHSVEGLSWGFLANWFLGDFTNFVGCILTHQLPFQTLLALYYVCIDFILGSQYYYYSKIRKNERKRKHHKRHIKSGHYSTADQDKAVPRVTTVPIPTPAASSKVPSAANSPSSRLLIAGATLAASVSKATAVPLPSRTTYNHPQFLDPLYILFATSDTMVVIGRISAWTCAFLYLSSRLPQIIKNFKRKSTWGTSMLLFFSALTGNVAYTISIVFSPEARGKHQAEFYRNEISFLIGSAGTVVFDLIIFFQYFSYGSRMHRRQNLAVGDDSCAIAVEDEDVVDDLNCNPSKKIKTHRSSSIYEHPHHQYPDSALVTSLFPSTAMPVGSCSPSIASPFSQSIAGSPMGTPVERTPLSSSLQNNYATVRNEVGNV